MAISVAYGRGYIYGSRMTYVRLMAIAAVIIEEQYAEDDDTINYRREATQDLEDNIMMRNARINSHWATG